MPQLTAKELEDKLSCMFADAGAVVGELLRCMVDQQIAAKVNEIQQLNALLNGVACTPPNPPST